MSIPVKVQYEGDLRRYRLSVKATFKELHDIITKLFPNLTSLKFAINYRDPDNDIITVANDRDLLEAIRLSSCDPNKLLRLCITPSTKQITFLTPDNSSMSLDSSWVVLPSQPLPVQENLPELTFGTSSPTIEKFVIPQSPMIIETSAPRQLPPRKTSEMCLQASNEIRAACMRSADETIAQTQSLYDTSVEQCRIYSAIARDICMTESAKILQTTEHIPSSIVKLSTELSDEIAIRCTEICAQTLASCGEVTRDTPQTEKTKAELEEIKVCCMELSDQIAQNCRDASSLIAAQIMSL